MASLLPVFNDGFHQCIQNNFLNNTTTNGNGMHKRRERKLKNEEQK